MIMPPGYGCDLDAQVDEALRSGTPDCLLVEDSWSPSRGVSLVKAVCINSRLDLVDLLFAAGATMTADGLASVIWWWSDAETVALILAHGVSHNAACLSAAVRHGKWDTVFVLLDHGAHVQTPVEADGVTVSLLHAAAWRGEAAVVRRLLERGAEVDNQDAEGMTPLMKACDFTSPLDQNRGASADAVYWLLKHGADANSRTPSGETPLLLCTARSEPYPHRRTNIAQMLVRFGADPNAVSPIGTTPLMFAARDNDVILARSLLNAGAQIDARTPNGRTALDVAKKRKSNDVTELLREWPKSG